MWVCVWTETTEVTTWDREHEILVRKSGVLLCQIGHIVRR